MRITLLNILIFGLLLSIISFSCDKKINPVVVFLKTPSNVGGEPNLHRSEQGELLLSWIEYDDEKVSLLFSKLINDQWGEPSQIAEGDNWFVNWADFPSISSYQNNDDHLVAHWLQKSDVGTFDYDVRMSQSKNGGLSWDSSFVIHSDGIAAEHGFVSMLPMDIERMFITWLDGRNTKTGDPNEDETGHGHSGAMSLRAAQIDINGHKYFDEQIDKKICDCCQTSAALTSCGPVVVYRDRSDEEIRDISISRRETDGWTVPHAVHHDNWKINGCPVNGPVVRALDKRVAVAWFTMSEDVPKVNVAFSDDCGDNFALPVRVDNGDPLGRLDMLMIDSNDVIVSWIELTDDQAEIYFAQINRYKGLVDKWPIVSTENSRRSGFPRLEKHKEEIILTWTAVKDTTTFVQTARIEL